MKITAIKDGQKVTATGVYRVSNDWYHDNSAIWPSLSSSMAHKLVNACPAVVWHESYLNPKREKKVDSDRFDVGTACHAAVLEGEFWTRRCSIVPAKSWGSARAKFLRKEAKKAGMVALLKSQADRVFAMRDAFMADKEARKLALSGQNELSYYWKDEENRIFLKARPDIRIRFEDGVHVREYKTSQGSSAPRALEHRMVDLGWFVAGAWYLDVMEKVEGTRPLSFGIVAQEDQPPYLLNMGLVDDLALQWGSIVAKRAIAIFTECLKTGVWPGYERGGTLCLPRGAEMGLEERKNRGDFGAEMRVDEEVAKRVFGWGSDGKAIEAY